MHIDPARTPQTIQTALAFIDRLGPYDRLAVVTTGLPNDFLDFTADREAARTFVTGARGQQQMASLVPGALEMQARLAMACLATVAGGMRADGERRAVLLISEGHRPLDREPQFRRAAHNGYDEYLEVTMMLADAFDHSWRRTCLAVVLTVAAAVRADARTAGQESTWARAVDAYLAGAESSVPSVLGLSPEEVATQSRAALDEWMARAHAAALSVNGREEWRLSIRRVQAAALLPLEILSLLSTRMRLLPPMKAYETASMEAWERLGDDDWDEPLRSSAEARWRHRRFRTWWQIAYLQFLMNNARYADFRARAQEIRLIEGDQAQRVEFFLLRGMVEESIARMPGAEARRRDSDDIETESRLQGMTRAFNDAAGWYRRVLESAPGHLEATVRLGRVLIDLERPHDALRTLRPLLDSPCGTTHCALASLFSGEAHEMLGASRAAATAYAHAASLTDVRQSALVALMQLAVRTDDAAKSTPLIGQLGEGTPLAAVDGPDAWSVHLRGRRQNINAVLRPLREAMVP